MSGRAARVLRAKAGSALIAALALASLSAQTPQAPTFRASTDAVFVTATVMRPDGALVTDLTEADFEIFDNGEPRPITIFRNDPVPFSVIVMLDISGSIEWFGGAFLLDISRSAFGEFVRQFQPGDRANVGTFASTPKTGPYFTADPQTLMSWMTGSMNGMGIPCGSPNTPYEAGPQMGGSITGGSAIWDAVGCGLARVGGDVETPRRVVLIVTDGHDHGSRQNPNNILKIATKAGIMVYTIGLAGTEGLARTPLQYLAEQTGGGFFALAVNADLPKTFARIADELRHQYVFGFSPSAVSAASHKVDVRVRRGDLKVHARQIYLEDVPIVATPGTGAILTNDAPAPSPAPPPAPRPLPEPPANPARGAMAYVLDRFEDGDWSPGPPMPLERVLGVAADGLKKSADAWIAEAGPAETRRRRLAVATYVLHLLEDAPVPAFWQTGQPASTLLEWACGFLRREPALEAERAWHRAAFALLERSAPAGVTAAHVAHAEERFPDAGEWALALGIAEEQAAARAPRPDGTLALPEAAVGRISAAYEKAASHPLSRAEAHLRWGYLEFLLGRNDEALSHFEKVDAQRGTMPGYLLQLFRGQALERANRRAEAIASYRQAYAAAPLAQSGAFALASVLVADGRTSEAAAIVGQITQNFDVVDDPWHYYLAGHLWFFQALMDDLKQGIKR